MDYDLNMLLHRSGDIYEQVLRTYYGAGFTQSFRPVTVGISGSHAYLTQHPRSDVDVRGIYLGDALAMYRLGPTPNRTIRETRGWGQDRPSLDIELKDLVDVARLIAKGNGNMVEMLYAPQVEADDALLGALRKHEVRLRSWSLIRHYLGLSRSEIGQWENNGNPKSAIYAIRSLLTAKHLLETGEVDVRFITLAYRWLAAPDIGACEALLAARRNGEVMSKDQDRVRRLWSRLQDHVKSWEGKLLERPDETAVSSFEDWLADVYIIQRGYTV